MTTETSLLMTTEATSVASFLLTLSIALTTIGLGPRTSLNVVGGTLAFLLI